MLKLENRHPILLNVFNMLLVLSLSLITACGDSVIDEFEQNLAAENEARRGVYVSLSTNIQTAMAIPASRTEISLRRVAADGTEYTSNLTVTDAIASDKPPKTKRVDDYQYRIQIWYWTAASNANDSPLLLAEANKISNNLRVEFATDEFYTAPYDNNGDQIIDSGEQARLDFDLDTRSNLAEIIEGGHPQNSSPTFVSVANIRRKESADTSGYSFYIASAISPRTATATDSGDRRTITYGLNTTATDIRLQNVLSIDPVTGALSTKVGQRLPAFDSVQLAANDYTIRLTASDITGHDRTGSIAEMYLSLVITDVFNLTVSTNLSINGTTGTLQFQWEEVFDASNTPAQYYQLLHDLDGDGGYITLSQQDSSGNPIPLKITGTEYFHDIPLHMTTPETRYKLEAYQTSDTLITTSAELRLGDSLRFPEDMTAMIGYFKAAITGEGDLFGASVSLSADGLTLAVGAPRDNRNFYWKTCDTTPQTLPCEKDFGAVHVFTKTASGWQLKAYLKASNAGDGDFFGWVVSLSADGKTLAVGARYESGGSQGDNCDAPLTPTTTCQENSGAVYVFANTPSGWEEQAYLKASNAGMLDTFGDVVSLSADGQTLAVGAIREDGGSQGDDCDASFTLSVTCLKDSGAVYVFANITNGWQEQAYLKPSNIEASDTFGYSLAFSADGQTLVAGAYGEDGGPQGDSCDASLTPSLTCRSYSGAAYIFTNTITGWQQQAYLKASNTGEYDHFGSSVALSTDGLTLVVAASAEDGGSQKDNCDSLFTPSVTCQEDSGAVYVFSYTISGWQQQAYLKASNTGVKDSFGGSVSLSADGQTLAVGAYREDGAQLGIRHLSELDPSTATLGDNTNAANDAGTAYIFQRLNGIWSLTSYLKASNTNANDGFGSVSLSADAQTLAIGAAGEAGGGNSNDCIPSGSGQTLLPWQETNCLPNSGAVYMY